MGLNTLRCHVKIPDRLYFDLADRLGLVVWLDMPYTEFLAPDDARGAAATCSGSRSPTTGIIRSICIWTLFNEGWGIDLDDNPDDRRWLIETFDAAKALVPDSLLVDNSPCFPRNYHLKTDIEDFHWYNGFPHQNEAFAATTRAFAARARLGLVAARRRARSAATSRWSARSSASGDCRIRARSSRRTAASRGGSRAATTGTSARLIRTGSRRASATRGSRRSSATSTASSTRRRSSSTGRSSTRSRRCAGSRRSPAMSSPSSTTCSGNRTASWTFATTRAPSPSGSPTCNSRGSSSRARRARRFGPASGSTSRCGSRARPSRRTGARLAWRFGGHSGEAALGAEPTTIALDGRRRRCDHDRPARTRGARPRRAAPVAQRPRVLRRPAAREPAPALFPIDERGVERARRDRLAERRRERRATPTWSWRRA